MSQLGTCMLCLADGPLRDSHILPEWGYQPLYDENHRFRALAPWSERPITIHQKGLRERLLCQGCETDLSVYEGYARGILIGGPEIQIQKVNGGVDVLGVDYKKFKLFELSLLWRSGVARQEFFSKVDLGSHSEPLRNMLRTADPGQSIDYGCHLVPLIADGQVLDDFIGQPGTLASGGAAMVRLPFAGYVWLFRLGPAEGYQFSNLFLDEGGRLPVRHGGRAIDRFVQGLAVSFGSSNG